jgi:hypothetical protein
VEVTNHHVNDDNQFRFVSRLLGKRICEFEVSNHVNHVKKSKLVNLADSKTKSLLKLIPNVPQGYQDSLFQITVQLLQ